MAEDNRKKRKTKRKGRRDIAWQNKDVSCKVLAEQLRGRDFSVYGLKLPKIADIMPTNLPAVEANELRIDNLFLLEDDSYAIIDYESEYREGNKQKYLGYLARLTKRLYNIHKCYKKIRMIVIYTADVEKGSTMPALELGAVSLQLTEVFLADMDSDGIRKSLEEKIRRGEAFSKEDLMRLVIYPLTFRGPAAKRDATHQAIKLADGITDTEQEWAVLKLLLAFTDKVISKEDREYIREVITMSGVEKMIENEKREAVKKAVEEVEAKAEQEKAEAIQEYAVKAEQEKAEAVMSSLERIVRNMIADREPAEKIARQTGVPLADVRLLEAEMNG